MLIFYIKEDSYVKDFMNKLFLEETFDNLEVRNVFLETIIKYDISCNINRDYLPEGETRYFVTWKEIKKNIFQLIKGSRKPKSMKIIFSLDDERIMKLSDNCSAMFLNVLYEGNVITCTTGTSQKDFSMNKHCDIAWENTILKFLKRNNIIIEKEG